MDKKDMIIHIKVEPRSSRAGVAGFYGEGDRGEERDRGVAAQRHGGHGQWAGIGIHADH